MKVSIKRKLELKVKIFISKVILFFLYRGFKATYKYDKRVREEIDNWEEGFSIKLQIAPNKPSLCLKKTKKGIIIGIIIVLLVIALGVGRIFYLP